MWDKRWKDATSVVVPNAMWTRITGLVRAIQVCSFIMPTSIRDLSFGEYDDLFSFVCARPTAGDLFNGTVKLDFGLF